VSHYRLSKDAEGDLLEIARYIHAKAGLEPAEKVLTGIIQTIIYLGDSPNVGRHEDSYGGGTRSFVSGTYKIYYRKRRSGILVLHVFHGARDQTKAWQGTGRRSR